VKAVEFPYKNDIDRVESCRSGASIPQPFYPLGQTLPCGRTLPGQSEPICIEGRSQDVVLHSRVDDVSRQALTWGAEPPFVRKQDVRAEELGPPGHADG
jgi:hypothetical protein